MKAHEKIAFYAILAALGLMLLIQLQAVWPFVVDDSWIPLRYARHLVAGLGLVWNPGEAPLEGFSSFSFMLLGAAALWLRQNPLLWLKIGGIIGLLATLAGVFTLTRFWFKRTAALIPVFWLLLYRGEMLWTVSGLETAVYQALILWAIVFALRGAGYDFYPNVRHRPEVRAFVLCGLLFSLAGMTRPEAPGLMALTGLWFITDSALRRQADGWRGIRLFVFIILLVWGSWFSVRWYYFGALFPNPVYCKGLSKDHYLLVHGYLRLIGIWLLAALPAVWNAFDRRFLLLLAPSVFYLLVLLHAEDIVAFDNRLFLPALPMLLPLPLLGLQWLLQRFSDGRARTLMLLLTGFAAGLFWMPSLTPGGYQRYLYNPLQGKILRDKTSHWLQAHSAPQSRIVFGDSGQIPWEVNAVFIDSFCLNNRTMAHMPRYSRDTLFCHTILAEKPDMVVLTELVLNNTVRTLPVDRCLKKQLQRTPGWQLVRVFSEPMSDNSRYQYRIYQPAAQIFNSTQKSCA